MMYLFCTSDSLENSIYVLWFRSYEKHLEVLYKLPYDDVILIKN